MRRLFSFLILVLFVQRIRGGLGNVTEEREIASRLWLKNNFSETLGETVITTAITVGDEKFDDNELKKVFVKNFKLNKYLAKEKYENTTEEMMSPQRKSRDVVNTTSHHGLECLSCSANGASKSDEDCYQGVSVRSAKCGEIEQCYTELHPLYIKRGCMLPGRLNRTFVCKCPLCNDKPSYESKHYEYKKISDWEFDNVRLQKPVVGIDIICKVCETKGANPASDSICKNGRNADYMVCGKDQICYTNVDDILDTVSRGCIPKPIYNSIYLTCNTTKCNNESIHNPKSKIKRNSERTYRLVVPIAKAKSAAKRNFALYLNIVLVPGIIILFVIFFENNLQN